MIISVFLLFDHELDDYACYIIEIKKIEDYEMVSSIINEGDIIEQEPKKLLLFVKYATYDENENGKIKVFGYETKSLDETF